MTGYQLKYRLEFDTIKGRSVKLDIEEDRNMPPANETFGGYSFTASTKEIVITNGLETNDLPDYIYKNDIVTVSSTSLNNGVYTVVNYEVYVADFLGNDVYFAKITVLENIADESELDEDITLQVTLGSSYLDLTPSSESPIELSYPNGEFDKMCPIRESKMRIKILSDVVTFQDFVITQDTQFKVKLYVNNNLEWLGWLDNDYITEPFLDFANEIELSANDGISFLKTAELSDENNLQLWGIYTLSAFTAYCLRKTNLDLNFLTFINCFPENVDERLSVSAFSDGFDYAYTLSYSFLNGEREFQDCYQVLSKIMQAFGCTLFQARGKWYIIQTNDRIANQLDATERNYHNAKLGAVTNQSFQINIGLNEVTKLINADSLVSTQKPFKQSVIKYSFDVPPFYFRNFDLLDGTKIDMMSTNQKVYYSILYWNSLNSALASYYNLTDIGYIVSEVDSSRANVLDQETLRYLAIPGNWNTNYYGAKRTTDFPVSIRDKIKFSYRVRYTVPVLVQGDNYVKIILTDGVNYRYLDKSGNWTTNLQSWVGVSYNQFTDRTNTFEYEITSKNIPFNGFISIQFSSWTEVGTGVMPFEVHYIDMKFDIDNAFNQRTIVIGQEYKNQNNFNLKNTFDNEIFLSNGLRVSNIGALLNFSNLQVATLRNLWKYKGTGQTIMPFSQYIARAYWRTMYRSFLRMEGRLYDLYQGSRLLSPLNTVEFNGIDDKEFMITTLNMDIRNESAEFTMVELRITSDNSDFVENGIESFRYVSEGTKDKDDPNNQPKTPLDYKYGAYGYVNNLLNRDKKRRFNNF